MLELQGLTRRYGEPVALDDLSFTVADGQMFGFVGSNGAGKTTAMRIVLGVLAPDAGEVRWRGQPMTDEICKRLGYLPEDHGQTFLQECAGLLPWRVYARKAGEQARYRRTHSRPPGGAGNRLHDRWVVSLGVTAMRSRAWIPPECTSSLPEPSCSMALV
jgi:ABC-type glutathione transport system ATPase component